ncbi:MAG: hypothetical protein P8170_03270 [Gemmatimonadota bacterium]
MCSWTVAGRQLLSLESGDLAYVEARSLSATERGMLLLGSPSYVWSRGAQSGVVVPRDSVVGAVIDSTGSARAVPAPLPGAEIRGLSAVGNKDGTWSVAFTVLRPETRFPEDEVAGQLGYGSFDGREWTDLQTEPIPRDVALNPMRPSPLVRGEGGGLLWSLPTRARAANAGVAILRRVGSHWRLTTDTPSRVFGLSVAHIPSWGEVVAIARADTISSMPRGTLRLESVELGGGVAEAFRFDPGPGNLWDPVFDRGQDPRWIGWLSEAADEGLARLEARAAPLYPRDERQKVMVLDSNSAALHPLGVLDGGASYWISHHTGEESQIVLVRTGDVGVERELTMPNPFVGPFGAVAPGPSRVLLAGPLMGRDERSPPVTTLMIHLKRTCREAS